MPGGGGCPSFVPHELVAGLQQNRAAVEAFATFCEVAGNALVYAGGIGIPIAAVGVTLSLIEGNCDAQGTLQSQARIAANGCTVGAVACGVGGTAAAVTGVGLPAAGALAIAGAVFAALAPIFGALGEGRSPKLSDIAGGIGALGAMAGVDTSTLTSAASSLDKVGNEVVKKPAVKTAAQGATAAQQRAAKQPLEDAQLRAAERASAGHTAAEVESGMAAVLAMPKATNFVNLKVTRYLHAWRASGSPIPAPPFNDRAALKAGAKAAAAKATEHANLKEAAKAARAKNATLSPSEVIAPGAAPAPKKGKRAVAALAGAAAGFFVGGPVGSAIGAGVGYFAGGIGGRG